MPGYKNKHMKAKKMSGKGRGGSPMGGKGMPMAASRKGGGAAMKSKGGR